MTAQPHERSDPSRCAEPSPRGTARCLRPPHPDHPDAHVWELADIDHSHHRDEE